jgi:hypothetical protein
MTISFVSFCLNILRSPGGIITKMSGICKREMRHHDRTILDWSIVSWSRYHLFGDARLPPQMTAFLLSGNRNDQKASIPWEENQRRNSKKERMGRTKRGIWKTSG